MVAKARAAVGQVKLDANNLTEASLKKYTAAQGELANALDVYKRQDANGAFFLIIKNLLCFLFFLHVQKLVVLVVEFVLEERQFL